MRLVLLIALAVVSAVAISLALRPGGDNSSPAANVAEHPVEPPATSRTVLISSSMPKPSPSEKRLSAMLEEGAMPNGPMIAEVLTDTDCAPDANMISHCRNEMRLPDGKRIVLRHPHDMSKVSCLAPGEQVRLVPQAA